MFGRTYDDWLTDDAPDPEISAAERADRELEDQLSDMDVDACEDERHEALSEQLADDRRQSAARRSAEDWHPSMPRG